MNDSPSELAFETTVVIPVYFNEKSVEAVVNQIQAAWQADGRAAESLEFVLVDDFSGDNSWQVLCAIRDRWPHRVTAVRLAKNHGSNLAVLAGASFAQGRRVAVIAADGQEPADLVPRMTRAADEGARVVLAARTSRADRFSTRAGAAMFYRLMRLLGLRNMPREGFDLFLLDRELMRTIIEMRDPNIPLVVTIAWLGYPYAQVHYDRLERKEGRSRWTLRKKIKLAIDAVTSVSYAPIRAISAFGTVLALCGFAYVLVVVWARLWHDVPVQGFTTLLAAVLILGGTQLISLGIIGEYLWRTLEVARRRPLWRIGEVHPRQSTPLPPAASPP